MPRTPDEQGTPPEQVPSPAPTSPRFSRAGARLAIAAALLVGALLLYLQVAHHAFIFYDDGQYVADNPRVRSGLSWANVLWAFTTLYFSNWHPLTWLSHMVDVQLFGLAPGAHHLVNAALHALNGAVLFLVLDRMTGARWRSAVVAALFAVHPLHVESVAWIAERKDLLSTLFGFLALGAYARYVERPGARRYAFVLLCFALSLLAKPMWVTFPFVLLLLDAWPLRRVGWFAADAQTPSTPVPIAHLLLEKVPLLGLSVASSVVTVVAQHRGGALVGLDVGLAARISNAVVSYARYLGSTLWPVDLAVFYPHRALPLWQVMGAALLVAAITVGLVLGARRWPWAAAGWLWFIGMLVPVVGLVQVGAQAMADRYTYVPTVGLFVGIVWGAHHLTRGRADRVLGAVAALALAVLALLTWRQTARWTDHVTLFRHTLAVTGENPRALGSLAIGLRRAGNLEEALLHASEAARIDPGSARHPLTIALIERDLRQFPAAYEAVRRAVEVDPELGIAWTLLGQIAGDLGRGDEAEAALRRATALLPEDVRAWNELGVALARNGRTDEAVEAHRKALSLDPGSAPAWSNLATLLLRLGRIAEAGDAFAAATRAEPGNPVAWRNLGVYFTKIGRAPEAAAAFREGLRSLPGDPDLLVRLGLAQLAQGARAEVLTTAAQLEAVSPEAAAELRARARNAP